MAPHKTRIVTLDSPDLESGATQPDPSNSEVSPLLPAATPHHHHHRSTPRVKESFSQRWWVGVLGGGLAVTVLVAGGILISRKASSPSDTPDFSKLPPPQPGGRNPSYLSSGWGGAVASEVDVCSEIGIEVLRDGGTATDAGIAVTLCIGTTNMFSSGIGGGGFMIIRPSTSHPNPNPNCTQPLSIDFRETAPSGAHARMFSPRPDDPTFDSARASRVGGLAIGVPGELRGLEAAYLACGGGLPWARLVQPAADLARKSKVGLELGRRLGIDAFSGWMVDAVNEGWAPFVKKGRTLRAGETLRRENYARTLETIGREGVDVFYEGHIAKSIIHTIEKAGGILTAKDLAGYRPIILPATKATYRNRTYYTGHAPSGGPVIVSLLNTLEGFPNYAEGGRTGLAVHRFIESLKFAFAARTELGDPAFIHNNKRLAEITTKAYAAQVRANISDDRTYTIDHYNPRFDVKEDHGTTHLSVIDSHGSAISITSTVNLLFGSRVMDVETGIILNDEMDDFATPDVPDAFGLRPSPFNFPAPGKRPLSSTSPLIMEDLDGEVFLAVGGSGGSRIFGAVAQVLLNLDWGFDLSNAIEQPRVHDQLSPAYVSVESTYRPDLLEALTSRGHNVSLFDISVGIAEVQAVLRMPDGKLFAASDSRKNGVPAALP